jgi:hypothetical protein
MASGVLERKPGEYAMDRFRRRRRAWLARVWWRILLVAAALVTAIGVLGLIMPAQIRPLFWAAGFGGTFVLLVALVEFGPAHIESWRVGAEGEGRTAKVLRPLTRSGWVLINDVPAKRGNYDHILIGPAGVFLLETKDLSGAVSVRHGVLSVQHAGDETDRYERSNVGPRVRGAAAQLSNLLRTDQGRVWVQPLVVLWAKFDQRSIINDHVAWVRGDALADVLAARPARLSAAEVAQISEALHAWAHAHSQPATD